VGSITPLDWILLAVFAGYTASFACVVAERGGRGERPDGRSRCVCGRVIPMYRNIPVVSWLLQRGRAACCGARIPAWYFLAEALTVVAALWATTVCGWAVGLLTAVLAGVAIVASYRWRHRRDI
jgi:prepilin signal peptidase PulO-like enzyme (type II secretory pathway)